MLTESEGIECLVYWDNLVVKSSIGKIFNTQLYKQLLSGCLVSPLSIFIYIGSDRLGLPPLPEEAFGMV